MKLDSPFLISPGASVRLARVDAGATPGCETSDNAEALLEKHRAQLEKLQDVFYASQSKALLIVLQGMDTAGKDGTIRHIFSGVNPQGCQVAAFKVPTALEQRHDFLWRCHEQVPPRGIIGIFNRSHYEDVLSPRVHGSISVHTARQRLAEINAWEAMLAANDVVILKFFLHISHQEQTARLQARIEDPDKHWKLSPADFHERLFWGDYQRAYQDILERSSTADAPWFVIPSNHKWYRNLAISRILADALQRLHLKYPPPSFDPTGIDLSKKSEAKVAKKAVKRMKRRGVDPERETLTLGRKA